MSLTALIIGIGLLLASAYIIAEPLSARSRRDRDIGKPSEREQLEIERDIIYDAIRELDFDHQTGKIDDEDYRLQRERWVERGIAVLKALDALEGKAPPLTEEETDALIEAAVAARRRAGST